ncbi:hypothetical protein FEM48_Zijuj09G0115300 [Ziziphus jujuba var. spinosa]|uniref:Fe2OG dioxygenase domain-containing protein n=1 Tax=Ziziphus jujuba var. spinosa TaxID=714518 RepID=A0A978USR9_ZIZJJ|nr:hypothetical protein FEM48_Zijuj09G0115300 [Ziziphus jujuba var. spinosa]
MAMGELDSAFIQDIEHRPNLKSTEPVDDGIPTIDLSALTLADSHKIVSEIGLACEEWGFFQIINHGVPLDLQRKVEKVARESFELPSEEKWKVKRDEANPFGYYDSELTKNVRDWKELFDFLVEDRTVIPASPEPDDKELMTITNQWPLYPPELRVCERKNGRSGMEGSTRTSSGNLQPETSTSSSMEAMPAIVLQWWPLYTKPPQIPSTEPLQMPLLHSLRRKEQNLNHRAVKFGELSLKASMAQMRGVPGVCQRNGKAGFQVIGTHCAKLRLARKQVHRVVQWPNTFIRINYYPPCPFPHLALGVGRHKDAAALTILAQDDVGGLQAKRKSDGEWITVKPTPNAYVVNVGDVLHIWSNEKYRSVEQRVVVNKLKERLSIPCFFLPGPHVMVKPVEELLNGENRPKYKEYNWGKFFVNRSRSDFKKLEVENIQIEHLRL